MALILDKQLDEAIFSECDAGAMESDAGNFELAEKRYLKSWDMFPEPKLSWNSSQVRLYAISDFYLGWEKLEKALEWAMLVFKTELLEGDGTPQLKVGIIQFEMGNLDAAYAVFRDAFTISGKRTFQGFDKKYLNFYLAKVKEVN